MTLAQQKRAIRILHVVGGMNRGGIETWLMHILRNIDRDRFQMDFLVPNIQPYAYDHEITKLGSKVIPCFHPSKPWLYGRNLKGILREYGSYEVVHSHIHHYSGYVLRLAHQAGISHRIAHSHIDTSSTEALAGWSRQLYLILMKRWITRYATHGIGCSSNSAAELFGLGWKTDPRWQLLYYGIDLSPFHARMNPLQVRAELGIPEDAFAIGHIGRFDPQKNHQFLIEIAAEVAKREPKMRLLLIGQGSLRQEIEHKVAQMGLTDRVLFLGSRSDIPRLMLGAMDVFLFPSLYEGLPLVLLEAQAAGLPCIFSDAITREVEVVKPLMQRMFLSDSASAWAKAVLSVRDTANTILPNESLALVEKSPFNIARSVQALEEIYTNENY